MRKDPNGDRRPGMFVNCQAQVNFLVNTVYKFSGFRVSIENKLGLYYITLANSERP